MAEGRACFVCFLKAEDLPLCFLKWQDLKTKTVFYKIIFCAWVFFLYMPHMYSACGGQKRASLPPGLALRTFVNYQVGAGI